MKPQQALRILLLSPLYFRLTPPQRLQLVKEYCLLYDSVQETGKRKPRGAE